MALYINGVLQTVVSGDLDISGDTTMDGDLALNGDLTLVAGGTIDTTANGDITLLPNGTGITIIGDAGTQGNGLVDNDDLFVSGKLEVDGPVFLDGETRSRTAFVIGGVASAVGLYCSQYDDDGIHYALNPSDGATNHNLILTTFAWRNRDHDHFSASVNPTLFIHSFIDPNIDNTQWVSFSHNQTDPVIGAGTGTLIVPEYEVHLPISISALSLGPTAPANVIQDQAATLEFDGAAERAYVTYEIPDRWNGTSDMEFELHWASTAGDAIADTETVKWDITYRSVAHGEATDNGTAATGTVTYTQSGAGTDSETFESDITLPYNDANQPLAVGDMLFVEIARDTGTDTYSGGALLTVVDLEFTANRI